MADDRTLDWRTIKKVAITVLDLLLIGWTCLYFVGQIRQSAKAAWTVVGLDYHYDSLWLLFWLVGTIYTICEIILIWCDDRTIVGILFICDLLGILSGSLFALISPLLWVEQLFDIPVAALVLLLYLDLKQEDDEDSLEELRIQVKRQSQRRPVTERSSLDSVDIRP